MISISHATDLSPGTGEAIPISGNPSRDEESIREQDFGLLSHEQHILPFHELGMDWNCRLINIGSRSPWALSCTVVFKGYTKLNIGNDSMAFALKMNSATTSIIADAMAPIFNYFGQYFQKRIN